MVQVELDDAAHEGQSQRMRQGSRHGAVHADVGAATTEHEVRAEIRDGGRQASGEGQPVDLRLVVLHG